MPDDVAAAVEAARRKFRFHHVDGDPLAAIRDRLAECVVLAEAAGDVEDLNIVEAMVFDALKWMCRAIAATKEAE